MTAEAVAAALNKISLAIDADAVGEAIRVRDYRSGNPLATIGVRVGKYVKLSATRAAELYGLRDPAEAVETR